MFNRSTTLRKASGIGMLANIEKWVKEVYPNYIGADIDIMLMASYVLDRLEYFAFLIRYGADITINDNHIIKGCIRNKRWDFLEKALECGVDPEMIIKQFWIIVAEEHATSIDEEQINKVFGLTSKYKGDGIS